MKTFYFHEVCFVLIDKPLLLFPVTLTSPCQPSLISLHWFLIKRQPNLPAHSGLKPDCLRRTATIKFHLKPQAAVPLPATRGTSGESVLTKSC